MMIGRKLTSGPGRSTPSSADPQPHWNTATTIPKVAPMVRRKPRAAFRGTSTERNARSSSRNDSPMTTAR